MRVTRIVKKGKKDVTIYFDEDTILILAAEVFLKSGLKKNDEISDDRSSALIEENIKFHIKQKAFRLLGRRQHSVAELKRKLFQHAYAKNTAEVKQNYDKKLIDVVINELAESGYLNDREFANTFVKEKLKTKKWSKRRLKSELIKKGINQNIISEILNQKISDEENFENALSVGRKKLDSLKKRNFDSKEIKSKLYTFLLSRGFDFNTIKDVSERLTNK